MNYRKMAAAIRAERKAIWIELGRPYFRPSTLKSRQNGWEGLHMAQAYQAVFPPWRDFWMEERLSAAMRLFWQGSPTYFGRTRGIAEMVEDFNKHYPSEPEDMFIGQGPIQQEGRADRPQPQGAHGRRPAQDLPVQ